MSETVNKHDVTAAAQAALRKMGPYAHVSTTPGEPEWVPATLPGWVCPGCAGTGVTHTITPEIGHEGVLDAVSASGHVRCTCGFVCPDKVALARLAALECADEVRRGGRATGCGVAGCFSCSHTPDAEAYAAALWNGELRQRIRLLLDAEVIASPLDRRRQFVAEERAKLRRINRGDLNAAPPLEQYVARVRALHQLFMEGRNESTEADALRDQMDGDWDALTESQRALVSGLTADLNGIRKGLIAEHDDARRINGEPDVHADSPVAEPEGAP